MELPTAYCVSTATRTRRSALFAQQREPAFGVRLRRMQFEPALECAPGFPPVAPLQLRVAEREQIALVERRKTVRDGEMRESRRAGRRRCAQRSDFGCVHIQVADMRAFGGGDIRLVEQRIQSLDQRAFDRERFVIADVARRSPSTVVVILSAACAAR